MITRSLAYGRMPSINALAADLRLAAEGGHNAVLVSITVTIQDEVKTGMVHTVLGLAQAEIAGEWDGYAEAGEIRGALSEMLGAWTSAADVSR